MPDVSSLNPPSARGTQPADAARPAGSTWAPALLSWALTGLALWQLDGRLDLANLALLLVLGAAVAAFWAPTGWALAAGTLGVLGFNWAFVPPRHTFHVQLGQHAVLLLAMLAVNAIVAGLMAAQRRQARQAQQHAWRAEQLRHWGEQLRDTADPLGRAGGLADMASAAHGGPVTLMLLRGRDPGPAASDADLLQVGPAPDGDQRIGLWHCLRQAQALGPGTGRHEDQPDLYLPLRSRSQAWGALLLPGASGMPLSDGERAHLQALCDQLGGALHRAMSEREEQQARAEAHQQSLRNSLLAAISHDYRTPLATILGAASSLHDQAARLDAAQQQRLARSIMDEASRLSRLTDNTLQLARLDGPGVPLRCDWESAEELVGTALQQARRHAPAQRVNARLAPGLPLLWCDALLMVQLLDNLIDNALKHSPEDSPVELLVQAREGQVLLAVRDRGPGIAPAWRERVFERFHRGASPMAAPAAGSALPVREAAGFGVGLAVCRAIAEAHGGELRLRARGHGGSAFECWLPLRPAPGEAAEAGAQPRSEAA